VSALPVGGPFGSWVGGRAADGRLGRDGALWSIGALYGLGGIALCWGLELQRINVVIGARLLLGVACGATTVVVPVYLGELAPPRLRGAFGTLTQLAMVVGILAADVVALGAGAGVLFAASALVALAMLLLAGALPLAATPKSVLAVGRAPRNTYGDVDDTSEDWVEAVELCKRLYALDDESARDEAHCIAAAAAAVARDEDPATPDADRGSLRRREEATGGDRAAVAARARRVLFASTFVLHATQQLSGINAVFYYSTTFLAGQEKSDSTSLQRECSARERFGNSTHASRALREMIARPKISRNEWKTTEIGAFEVGNFAPFSCPGSSTASSRTRPWARRSSAS
jgi:SP family facilitated glucose transporter-like MFS transporter 3